MMMKKMTRAGMTVLIAGAVFLLMMVLSECSTYAANGFSNARTISLGQETTGTGAAGSWEQYYCFNTTSNNSFYEVKLVNSSVDYSVGATLYDSDMVNYTDYIYVSKNDSDSCCWKLDKKERFYIKISGKNQGKYKLTVTEIRDDAGDDTDQAAKISIGKNYEYRMNVNYDEDWFYVDIPKGKAFYKISIINKNCNSGLNADLYDDNIVQYNGSLYAGKNKNDWIFYKLPAGRRTYLRVKCSQAGNYIIKITREKDPAGEDYTTAKKMTAEKKIKGRISCSDDDDWYMFKVPATGKYYVKLNKGCSFDLYDGSANRLDSYYMYQSGSGKADIGKLKKGRKYYIRISGSYSSYNYGLTVCRKVSRPGKPKITVKSGEQCATVKYKKPSKAVKYQVACRKENGSWKYRTTTKKSISVKKLESGKEYSFKVRAYSKENGKYYAGKWSSVKTVTIK